MYKIVGLTGSIASGKSTVRKIFEDRGYETVDTDSLAKEVEDNSDQIKQDLQSNFGEDTVVNNQIDRKKLGRIVFNDQDKMDKLNQILDDELRSAIKNLIEKYRTENKTVFFEIPLLFEGNYSQYFDITLAVYVDKETEISRLMNRNNIDRDTAENMMDRQMSSEEKRDLADYYIDNSSGNVDNLNHKVNKFLIKSNIVEE